MFRAMSVKLLTEHRLEVLSLKGGCTGSSESTLVKMPHCWKSHAAAHLLYNTMDHPGLNLWNIELMGRVRPVNYISLI